MLCHWFMMIKINKIVSNSFAKQLFRGGHELAPGGHKLANWLQTGKFRADQIVSLSSDFLFDLWGTDQCHPGGWIGTSFSFPSVYYITRSSDKQTLQIFYSTQNPYGGHTLVIYPMPRFEAHFFLEKPGTCLLPLFLGNFSFSGLNPLFSFDVGREGNDAGLRGMGFRKS